MQRMDASQEPAPVYATVGGDHIRVRLGPGFTAVDLEIVKRIRGRRWQPDARVWLLPHSPPALASLRRGFGDRLVLDGEAEAKAPAQDTAAAAGVAAADAGAGCAAPESAAETAGTALDDVAASDALVTELRRVVRLREYSRKTEKAYVGWVRRYFQWARQAPAREGAALLDEERAVAFLEHLAHDGLAARSRNQAASALNFLLREVLHRDDIALPRAGGPVRMPLVLTHREVMRLLRELRGKYLLIGMLLYSSGLRIGECMNLRIKDIDFELRQILVRDGKGRKDRYVPLAGRAVDRLRAQARRVLEQHASDLRNGHGWAPLPGAMHRKDPSAGYQPGWQFLFPARTINVDEATGRTGRWSLHVTAAEREFKLALRRSGITKRATCHTLRHSFATETLRGGCDIRTLQHVMGHRDIRTTTSYLHVVQQTGMYVRSPLDRPDEYEDFSNDILPALFPEETADTMEREAQPGQSAEHASGERRRAEARTGRRQPDRPARPQSEPRA
jgi:integron integrase